jgi:hypothetical protein
MPGADRVAATTSKRPGSILRLRMGRMSMTDSETSRLQLSGSGRSGDFSTSGQGAQRTRASGCSAVTPRSVPPAFETIRLIEDRRHVAAAFNGLGMLIAGTAVATLGFAVALLC